MDAVAGQKHVALRRAAIIEVGDDAVPMLLDPMEPLAVRDCQATPRRLAEENVMKSRSQDGHTELRPAKLDAADRPPLLIAEHEAVRGRSGSGDAVGQPERAENAHAIGCDLEAAADGGRFGIRFEDQRLDAAALKIERNRRTSDPAADDEGASCVFHEPTIACASHLHY